MVRKNMYKKKSLYFQMLKFNYQIWNKDNIISMLLNLAKNQHLFLQYLLKPFNNLMIVTVILLILLSFYKIFVEMYKFVLTKNLQSTNQKHHL